MYKVLKRPCAYRRNFEILLLFFTLIIVCILFTQFVVKSLGEVKGRLGHADVRLARQQQLKSLLHCHDQSLKWERLQYGNYWLYRNFIRGRLSANIGCSQSITYTTNGDYTFMENLGTVVTRWMGPISFALFAPGYDFNTTMDSILYARHCLPESQLIRDYVTFHIYFPNKHMPPQRLPLTETEALQWPYDCDLPHAPYEDVQRSEMYKTEKNLTYPINVGRNIARKAANTYFIFACDIELYPNLGFIDQFLTMAVSNISLVVSQGKPRVFPLPVFELQNNATLPDDKQQLVAMIKTKMAIPFHEYICKTCHLVPQQDKWVKANFTTSSNLEVFTVGKRQDKFVYWEPFYVSDNLEPEFDERVTWEGQSNKRIQNYAMCLLDYEYHILHPAFLVHSPGIKRTVNKTRLRYVAPMNQIIANTIKPEYKILYGQNNKCKV